MLAAVKKLTRTGRLPCASKQPVAGGKEAMIVQEDEGFCTKSQASRTSLAACRCRRKAEFQTTPAQEKDKVKRARALTLGDVKLTGFGRMSKRSRCGGDGDGIRDRNGNGESAEEVGRAEILGEEEEDHRLD
jgi:hypothetical protein